MKGLFYVENETTVDFDPVEVFLVFVVRPFRRYTAAKINHFAEMVFDTPAARESIIFPIADRGVDPFSSERRKVKPSF